MTTYAQTNVKRAECEACASPRSTSIVRIWREEGWSTAARRVLCSNCNARWDLAWPGDNAQPIFFADLHEDGIICIELFIRMMATYPQRLKEAQALQASGRFF